jgi:hypothetical protein
MGEGNVWSSKEDTRMKIVKENMLNVVFQAIVSSMTIM